MDWARLLMSLAIVLVALQVVWLHFQLRKVIDLSIKQGQILGNAIYDLQEKGKKND
jgi:cell division protein FtsL